MMPQKLKTYSPIDNSVYVERLYAEPDEISRVLDKAQAVQNSWRHLTLQQRAQLCSQAVAALVAKKETLAFEISWQMGRPIRYADGEIDGLLERANYMIAIAEEALANIHLPENEGYIRYITREPLGIALIIAPWNYPYLTAVNAIIPALLAGNVVILKHSAQTPLVAERFAEAFALAGLPEGVFQYLHLTHQKTESLIQSPHINYVAFTGSVDGGKKIEQAATGRFLSVGLELGGKDPAYVRADADIEHAASTVIDGAFFNSGQSCCAIERVYVHQAVYDAFVKRAVHLTRQYVLGRSDDPETTLGPMVNAAAAAFVRKQIQEAVELGATAHIDPHLFPLDKPGSAYMAPQILTEVNHQMRVMVEESFGPVVGIMPVQSDQEAVHLMNDSDYGLTAAVFTQDIVTGIALGEQIHTGTFFINRCDYLDPALAWTGMKNSGRGCSLSSLGFASLTRPKSFHIKR